MHGRYQLLEWIVQCIKSDFPEELSAVLNKSANFGEEIGLLSITPLVCAITSEDVDTVAVLSKEKVNLEKCKIFKKRPERKNGRCADRQRKLINDAAKTPNEIASSIKDKKARVAIKTLLRKQQDNVSLFNIDFSNLFPGTISSRDEQFKNGREEWSARVGRWPPKSPETLTSLSLYCSQSYLQNNDALSIKLF